MPCDPKQKSQNNVQLTINGGEVELNDFVRNFISQTILGMVKPLKGVENIETIELKISPKSP